MGVVTQIDEQGKVTMRSTQSTRILPLVPEIRVRLMAKSISSDDVYTRGALHVIQKAFEKQDRSAGQHTCTETG